MNEREFSEEIRTTKTALGVPISTLINTMRDVDILDKDVNVFIYVDQYEDLAHLDGVDYRAVINRALARRDPSVSYRIGSRGHAWHNHGLIFGTSAKLEEERDYKFIDLDQMLRRHENSKTWVFPNFAADVFARRLRYAKLVDHSDGQKLIKQIFGPGMPDEEKARKYAGNNRPRAVRVNDEWPQAVKDLLSKLVEENPLSARLGEAWDPTKGVRRSRSDIWG